MRNRPVRLILAGLLAAAVLAGCGSKKDNRNAITSKVTTTTAADDATVDSAAGTPSGSQSTAANNLQNSSKSPTTAKPSGSISASSPSVAQAAGLQPTAPGNYTYQVNGTAKQGVQSKTINEQHTLTVSPPTGSDQKSSTQTNQGSQEMTLRYLADGIYLVDLNLSGAIDFPASSPVLNYPEPAPVGKAWSWTLKSKDGGTTLNANIKILRAETLTIGGESVSTNVLDVTINASGNFVATLHSTDWVSEKYRLIVQSHDIADVSQPAFFAGHSDTTSVMKSTKPS